MQNKNHGFFRNSISYALIILAVIFLIYSFFGRGNNNQKNISTTTLIKQLKQKKIKNMTIRPDSNGGIYTVTGNYKKAQKTNGNNSGIPLISGYQTSRTRFTTHLLNNDSSVKQVTQLANRNNISVNSRPAPSNFWSSILSATIPTLILFGLLYWMLIGSQRGGKGAGRGGGLMNFGQSKTKPSDPKKNKVRFSDVAGVEAEKQELVEVVEFLKDPKKFTRLGAHIPKGVLLEGPPGTGKTLLAKAVAGEARVPFFNISGSDFVEMFVGVGASRVRSLFENAKKAAPSIIFIDEIDAVGRRRGAGMGGGNDEREQTLNQILIEMDGFVGNEGVIVLASTNRAELLDPALTRSGRFDRKIMVGAPDVRGREAILRVHAKNKPLNQKVNLKVIAQQTPGFVGSDLENLLNEAALLAARGNKSSITPADLDEAEDRIIAGPAQKDKKITGPERERVSFHEAGHALVGLVMSDARVVRKVTIVPRGRTGGFALMMPKEETSLLTEKDAKEQLAGLMGGRAAEMIIYHQASSGAANDFQQATQLARRMVTEFGMSKKLGMVQLEGNANATMQEQVNPNPEYSQRTSELIDEEVHRLTNEAYQRAVNIITGHSKQHHAIANALREYETLNEAQIKSLYKTGHLPGGNKQQNESSKPLSYEQTKEAAEKKQQEEDTTSNLTSSSDKDNSSDNNQDQSNKPSKNDDDHSK